MIDDDEKGEKHDQTWCEETRRARRTLVSAILRKERDLPLAIFSYVP